MIDTTRGSKSLHVPEMMDAWVIRENRHGSPLNALRKETIRVPAIGPTEVLLSVMAAGVNFNGVWACRGYPVPLSGLKTGYDFHIPGSDAAGIILQVGSGVERWTPGDEVIVTCNVSCHQCPACDGPSSLACEHQRIWGFETNWGSFAPIAKVQVQQLLPKPPRLSWEEAGSYGLCLFTAYRMLVTQGGLRAGENVLLWGAGGGLGVFAIQLCLLFGAHPICVVSSIEKANLCRRLGAELIIDRQRFDLTQQVGIREFGRELRHLTGGEDPDIVFEHVGQATFPTSVYVCKRFGRIVICGATTGYDLTFDVRHLWMRQKSIIGSHIANLYEADQANRLVIEGKIQPVLTHTLAFNQVPEAQALQEDRYHLGKIAVLIGAPESGMGRQI
jgi:crotonyl-CoA carboxylase/reductase